jgi:hypothetical protein
LGSLHAFKDVVRGGRRISRAGVDDLMLRSISDRSILGHPLGVAV